MNAFQDEAGNWDVDEDQTMKMKCDYVISAFGSGLYSDDLKSAMAPIRLNRWGTPEVVIHKVNYTLIRLITYLNYKVDTDTMETSERGVFCGGDLAGTAETAVEAVNDGKIAAWTMHSYLQVLTVFNKISVQ